MQFPAGPACIFLRKGIAEKQRVRQGDWQGGQGGVGQGEKGQVSGRNQEAQNTGGGSGFPGATG